MWRGRGRGQGWTNPSPYNGENQFSGYNSRGGGSFRGRGRARGRGRGRQQDASTSAVSKPGQEQLKFLERSTTYDPCEIICDHAVTHKPCQYNVLAWCRWRFAASRHCFSLEPSYRQIGCSTFFRCFQTSVKSSTLN
jgi:hypothetical protein